MRHVDCDRPIRTNENPTKGAYDNPDRALGPCRQSHFSPNPRNISDRSCRSDRQHRRRRTCRHGDRFFRLGLSRSPTGCIFTVQNIHHMAEDRVRRSICSEHPQRAPANSVQRDSIEIAELPTRYNSSERRSFHPPLVEGALAWIECETEAIHEAGDHWIVVARVLEFDVGPVGNPLIFFKGEYSHLDTQSVEISIET